MKSSLFSLFFTTQAVLGAVLDAGSVCNADTCARVVTGTQAGTSFVSQAKADCSSRMRTTVTPAAR